MSNPIQPVRAAALADSALASGGDTHQYLTFTLGGEMFAVGILNVKEIIEYDNLTEIPMMPNFIRGVINLRGSVVPVIDLAARFGGPQTRIQRRTCIVFVEMEQDGERHDLGIMVDAVSEVLEIPAADIKPPPAFGADIRTDFIAGMGKVGERMVIILAIRRVLSVDDMSLLATIDGNPAALPDSEAPASLAAPAGGEAQAGAASPT